MEEAAACKPFAGSCSVVWDEFAPVGMELLGTELRISYRSDLLFGTSQKM